MCVEGGVQPPLLRSRSGGRGLGKNFIPCSQIGPYLFFF